MKMKQSGMKRRMAVLGCSMVMMFLGLVVVSPASSYKKTKTADRAVEIAKRARDKVEQNGKRLKDVIPCHVQGLCRADCCTSKADRYP